MSRFPWRKRGMSPSFRTARCGFSSRRRSGRLCSQSITSRTAAVRVPEWRRPVMAPKAGAGGSKAEERRLEQAARAAAVARAGLAVKVVAADVAQAAVAALAVDAEQAVARAAAVDAPEVTACSASTAKA